MRRTLLFLAVITLAGAATGQDFSNKGKDFWVGYGSHCDMYNGNGTLNTTGGAQEMVLYFATETLTNVTVSIPTIGYSQTYSNIAANTIFETPPIPKSGANDARLGTEGTLNRGIHITSDHPIVAYAHIYNGSRSGATLLFPTNTLGKEYYSLNMSQNSQQAYSYCYFFVVATDTGTTTIQVIPSANTQTMIAGQTYTYNLTQGQVFNALGTISGNSGVDLTGSKIISIANSGKCKPIAVFSGSGKINLNCPVNAGGSADNYIVQSFPKTAWGKNYLTVPTYGMPYNYFRIAVSDPAAVVKLNGVQLTGLINNFYYQFGATNQPNAIESDKPIMVAQYITTTGVCGNNVGIPNGDGDPEVIYLSPIEQNISRVLLYATPHFAINEHFISVLIPNGGTGVSSFRLDGAVPTNAFVVHPQNSNYSYLQQQVSVGAHTLQSDSGFNASAYGYGNVESYGYNAGTNIKDLYQQIGVQSQYGIESTPSVCTNSPFRFKVSLPYIPDSMYWNFHSAAGMLPNNTNVMVNNTGNVAEDSFTVVNGKTIHWYSLPTYYTFSTVGVYPITITTYVPNADCGSVQDIDFDLTVSDPPVADFNWISGACVTEAFQFTETTPQFPKPTYHFWWDFDDPGSGAANNSSVRNPTHLFSTSGIHNVRFVDITTPGCLSDTIIHQVVVSPLPTGTISGSTTICINSSPLPLVSFTGSGGTAPYTFTYTINNGAPLTVNSTGNTATVTAPTNIAGTFTYRLINVKDTGTTLCTQTVTGQEAVIEVLPDHNLSLSSPAATANQTVCINTPILPIVYALGGGATGANISGLPPGVTFNIVGTVLTISGAPTTITGSPFSYSITTTGNACLNAQATGTITVNPDHAITLVSAPSTTNQAVCRNSQIDPVIYNLSGGATGVVITGLPPGVTGVVTGGTLTISGAPSTTAGSPYHYSINTTGNSCVIASASGDITVKPLPVADFSSSLPSCETGTVSFTDVSVPNLGVLNAWYWDFGDPASGALNYSLFQNPVHSYASAGIYIVKLVVSSTSTCISDTLFKAVVVNDRPKAGYIIPEVCLNDTYAQFLDTSHIASGSIVGWNWNFGDPGSGANNISSLQNPQHSYSAVGTYPVSLIVTSNAGCKDTIVQNLTVNGSFPVANFTVNNPASLCANDSVAIVNISTVFPGSITKLEIWWDDVNAGPPAAPQVDDYPFSGKIYRHLYPDFQSPLTKVYRIRLRAYSGGVCLNDKLTDITINASPKVQFNAIPDICLFAAPYQLTQASETGGVPGTGVYSGPGTSPGGLFNPLAAGVGTHTILYTFSSTAAGCVDTMSNTITVIDTAHANFSWVSPICDAVPASFTDQSFVPLNVTLSNTVWDFGDGSPLENHAPGSTFTHLFPAASTYQVKMYNVSTYGCNSTVTTKAVTVDPNHTINLSSAAGTDNQSVCINTPITTISYTLGGGATGATITGLPAGLTTTLTGNIFSIQGSPTSTAGSPNHYIITTTGNSCTKASMDGFITVKADHTLTLTSAVATTDQRVCMNTPIANIIYTTGGGATGAIVNNLPPGVNAAVSGNILTISGSPASTAGTPYNYTISTTGNSCVIASATGVIKVSPYPVPSFVFDKPGYCIPNALVKFNNTSTIEDGTESQFIFAWDFGDPGSGNNSSSAHSPSHFYASTGTYPVKLSVTSGYNCTHDTTIMLTTIHPQPKADFTKDKESACLNEAVTFTDKSTSPDGVAITEWYWNLGDGGLRNSRVVSGYRYADTTTYSIIYYVVNAIGCNSDTITRPFTVFPLPHVNAGPDRYILEGGTIILQPDVFANEPQYLWTPDQYLDDNKLLHVKVIRPLSDMTYLLTVTGRGACNSSDAVFIKLLKFPIIPNTFTPNNDGINDTWRIEYLNTYPNNRVQVFSRTGQLVFESNGYNTPWDGTYKGKPLPVDTYYYIIEPGSGRDPITGYVTIIK